MEIHRLKSVLLLLERHQVVTEIFDSLLNYRLIVVVHVLEDAAPGGHVGGTVRGDARSEAQDIGDKVGGEFAAVAFGQGGEICSGNFQRGSSGAVSFGIEAMAGGAKLFEHRFAGGHKVGGVLVLAGGRLGLRAGGAGKHQHGCDEKCEAHEEPPLADGLAASLIGSVFGQDRFRENVWFTKNT